MTLDPALRIAASACGRRLSGPRATLAMVLIVTTAASASGGQIGPDLSTLSLEELLRIEITTASRKPEPLATTPAAVFVITADDISHSTASSLPELLRMVPGVQVSRYSGTKWAIGARGMATYYSNKLLVLMDGRSLYTPDFSGVYWDVQDVPLEDIERIEVIRGPGGTMWGANAVNGVINIISKHAASTRGLLATVATGTEDRAVTSVRFGDALGSRSNYRVYAKMSDRRYEPTGTIEDSLQIARGGVRFDRDGANSTLTVQGDAYSGDEHAPLTLPLLGAPYVGLVGDDLQVSGADVLARWTRTFSADSSLAIKAYVDHARRNEYIHDASTSAFDVDLQHRFRVRRNHDLVWGLEHRTTRSDIGQSDVMTYTPALVTRRLFSAFAQDEIAVTPRLAVTLGAKVEHHQEVGMGVAPNVRALWDAGTRGGVWGAVSQSVRTPSLADQHASFRYLVVPPSEATRNLPVEVRVVGDPNQQALESVLTYEAGYRVQPFQTLAFDVTAFRNQYTDLSSYARGPATVATDGGVRLLIKSMHENRAAGVSHGVESSVTWTPTRRWTVAGTATYLQVDLRMTDPAVDPGNSLYVMQHNPRAQMTARSTFQWARADLEGSYAYVGPWQAGGVAGYSRVDARAGWQLSTHLHLDVGGQNLLDSRHMETSLFMYETPTEIRRSAFARLAVRF